MLCNIVQSLCAILALSRLTHGRAIAGCSSPDCLALEIERLGKFGYDEAVTTSAKIELALPYPSNLAATKVLSLWPRIEPIIEPKPVVDPIPDSNDPGNDPSLAPGSTSPTQPSTDPDGACIIPPGSNIKRSCPDPSVSQGHEDPTTSNDQNDAGIAEAPAGESTQQAADTTDFFALVRNSDPTLGPNKATDCLQRQFNANAADEAIADVDQVNAIYNFGIDGSIVPDEDVLGSFKDEDSEQEEQESVHNLARKEGVFEDAGIDLPATKDPEAETPGK